jgi:uncharacterized repeat protein (TIGR03803 family)
MNIAKALIRRAICVLAVLLGLGACVAWAQADGLEATSVNFETLHSFSGADGANPRTALIQATDGDFYATTEYGGANCAVDSSCGTIFKITPAGALTTVYSFCAQTGCSDGRYPALAGLVQATNGDLYGTTQGGGAYCAADGCGTIFKITLGGTLTTLYSFCAEYGCPDGYTPLAGLIQAANGELYGTTENGGTYNGGTVFKITPSGTLTTLSNFSGCCADGYNPWAQLMQAANGDLYGTTYRGGANGYGAIFKITPSNVLTTLYSFCAQSGCTDGVYPIAGLVQAANGDLYGTTPGGGDNSSTVFKITTSGTLTTVYRFCSQGECSGGNFPEAGLIQAASGDLYGTAEDGGAYGGGTIFKITPDGTFTTLYSFCAQTGCPDGQSPASGLIQGTNGIFYGTTDQGGATGFGTVFSISTGEHPFVATRPAIGAVGETVTIIGYGLKGATSVTFNGIPATILYDAPTAIYAKVPDGATTGKVQVVTPSGTLSSNVPFEVAPSAGLLYRRWAKR